ncbi:MAG TPA: hypothetical protein VIR54_25090, partial [Vicinamibacterales bacterium]
RTGDRQVVASLVRYPARVSVRQRPFPIYVKDRDALEQMYDMVFTPHGRRISGGSRSSRAVLRSSGYQPRGVAVTERSTLRNFHEFCAQRLAVYL